MLESTKDGPALLIFMHAADAENGIKRTGLQFLRPVDKYAAASDKLAAHIIWVSSDNSVMEVVDETKRHFIGTRTGLLDDRVLNLGVDLRGRVWTLIEKGISIIEPL